MRSPLLDFDYNVKTLRKVITEVKKSLGEVNLYVDLGSGDGTLTEFVANILKPRRTICIDISEDALSQCCRRGFETLKVDLNLGEIPLPEGSADVITAFELIEHLWNKDNMLEQAYRILKARGYLILSTPNLASLIARILLLLGKTPPYYGVSLKYDLPRLSYGHISLYTYELLLYHLRVIGFKVILWKGLLTPLVRKNVFLYMLTTLLTRFRPHLAPDILAVARKP